MKFTRRQVLEAIRFENLAAGNFYEVSDPLKGKKECKVCAVGGLLRRAGVRPSNIVRKAWSLLGTMEFVCSAGNVEKALDNKDYLRALSVKFEQLAEKFGSGKRTRRMLGNFVKANFPKEFTSVSGKEVL